MEKHKKPTRPKRRPRTAQTHSHGLRHVFSSRLSVHPAVTVPVPQSRIPILERQTARSILRPRYAYITLVMCGDDYAIAAAVLAWSLKKHGTQHELVVMVTHDVSIFARKLLSRVFDRVIKVKYILAKAKSGLRGKNYRRESTWMDRALTKARMLKLTEYDKILWMDADMLAVDNPDSVFDLDTPAGVCSSIRDHVYWHGMTLPSDEVENSMIYSYGIYGCLLLLKPDLSLYLEASTQPRFGSKDLYLGPDEFYFSQLYKEQWKHIHVKYACSSCHQSNGVRPVVLHFAGDKPWHKRDTDRWEGVTQWWEEAFDLIHEYPEMIQLLPSRRRFREDKVLCPRDWSLPGTEYPMGNLGSDFTKLILQ